MSKKYFYSPNLDECAACGTRLSVATNIGAVTLDAPGSPLLHYTLCRGCAPRCNPSNALFIRDLEQRLVARGHELGAYGPQSMQPAVDTKGGSK